MLKIAAGYITLFFKLSLFSSFSILSLKLFNLCFFINISYYFCSSSLNNWSCSSFSLYFYSYSFFCANSYWNWGSFNVFSTSLSLFLTSSVIEPKPSKSSLSSSSSWAYCCSCWTTLWVAIMINKLNVFLKLLEITII